MADGEKVCVICGESCVGQARIKNERGQYAHKACVEAHSDEDSAGDVELYDDALGGDMDDLLGDIEEQEAINTSAMACPGCGQRMVDGTVVCMGCGYNTQSGKSIATKSKEAKAGGGAGMAAMSGIAKASGGASSPMIPFVGALIGGVIGALIWAAISYFFNYEIGIVAWAIGGLVGFGATVGPMDGERGGALFGVMAAVIAMASIAGGKYASSYFQVKDYLSGPTEMSVEDVDDDWVMGVVAEGVCHDLLDAGEELAWPDVNAVIAYTSYPEDYPQDIRDETDAKWDAMGHPERRTFRKKIADEQEMGLSDITDEWAITTLADNICRGHINKGETIEWPNPNLLIDYAMWPDEYPANVQSQTNERWAAMSADEQYSFRQDIADRVSQANTLNGTIGRGYVNQLFIQSFYSIFDLVFIFLAVITAYGIAANEE